MSDKYVLQGQQPIPMKDVSIWSIWMEFANRRVMETHVNDVSISTVFLGFDHQFGDGPPLLFETMVFRGEHDQHQEQCSTWEQAEEQHRRVVEFVTQQSYASN